MEDKFKKMFSNAQETRWNNQETVVCFCFRQEQSYSFQWNTMDSQWKLDGEMCSADGVIGKEYSQELRQSSASESQENSDIYEFTSLRQKRELGLTEQKYFVSC